MSPVSTIFFNIST